MKNYRALLPLFFAFALLSAQQGGAVHALSHSLEQTKQQDKQAPHSPACEQCATYAQLGSALNVGAFNFILPAAVGEIVAHRTSAFRSIHTLAAAARGPPAALSNFA